MGIFRLRRKTKNFGFIENAIHAKGDNWEITRDIFKNEGMLEGAKSLLYRSPDQLQRSANRLARNGKADVANRLVERQNFLGIGGKIHKPTVPSTNASIAMGAPAGPSIGGTGAGVGGY